MNMERCTVTNAQAYFNLGLLIEEHIMDGRSLVETSKLTGFSSETVEHLAVFYKRLKLAGVSSPKQIELSKMSRGTTSEINVMDQLTRMDFYSVNKNEN